MFFVVLIVFVFVARYKVGCSQYHLAVAGGCEPQLNDKKSFAPTRYREVVLITSKHKALILSLIRPEPHNRRSPAASFRACIGPIGNEVCLRENRTHHLPLHADTFAMNDSHTTKPFLMR